MRLGTLPLFALVMFGALQQAQAYIVTLEPDAYAAGTDVSNAWAHEGITMRAVSAGTTMSISPVYSFGVVNQPAYTGSRMFGHHNNTSWGAINSMPSCYLDPRFTCRDADFAGLHISFDRPVDFVEAFGVWSVDWLGMILIGADGRRLESVYTNNPLFTDGVWYYGSTQVQHASRDIYGVILGGVIGSSSVDMIRVNIPEPGTIALLSLGLLGIVLTRRRNREAIDA